MHVELIGIFSSGDVAQSWITIIFSKKLFQMVNVYLVEDAKGNKPLQTAERARHVIMCLV